MGISIFFPQLLSHVVYLAVTLNFDVSFRILCAYLAITDTCRNIASISGKSSLPWWKNRIISKFEGRLCGLELHCVAQMLAYLLQKLHRGIKMGLTKPSNILDV